MQKIFLVFIASILLLMVGCTVETGNTNTNRVNENVNLANTFNNNTNINSNVNANVNTITLIPETREPEEYQGIIQLKLQATGDNKMTNLPTLQANVARSGADRRMEFNLPNGDKVVYLDKAGTTYVIIPTRKQYGILDKETLGFDVRQLMMPGEIVDRVKNARGIERVGEENVNGRQVIKYRYDSTANTQTKAGQVETDSFILIDKETGLPLHSEIVSRAENGNVQGYKGLRVITEMKDIKTDVTPELFAVPTDYQKIQVEQLKSQVEAVFNAIGLLLQQALNSPQTTTNTNTNANMAR